MPNWRKIVVDGTEYRWKFGTGVVCVRLNDKTFAKYDTTKLLGLTNDEHERAIWKRSMFQSVTPNMIAEAIRTVRNGDPCPSRRA